MTRARLVAALLLTMPGVVCAQTPSERDALQLFRDSLAVNGDTTKLRALEIRTIELARKDRDDPILHLRLGFIAVRLGELGKSSTDFDHAAGEFEWAVELRPKWPYPWFGLGLAEARLPDHVAQFGGGIWTMLGIDPLTKAGSAFAQAIRNDPMFVEGLISFSETVREQSIDAPLGAALDAVRQATATPAGWHPQLLLERGRLERQAGFPDSAKHAFEKARQLSRAPDVIDLELARTIPLTSDTFPAARGAPTPTELAYFAGAASADPSVVRMYRRDLEPLLDDALLARLDSLHGEARVTWLRAFWAERDQADLRPRGSRLSEHFRRWDMARRVFRLPPFRKQLLYGVEIFHDRDSELDDRGLVWIRHGTPDKRIIWPPSRPGERAPIPAEAALFSNASSEPSYGNETWRYARADGDLVLHFTAREDLNDYRLVESVFQLDVALADLELRAAEVPGLNKLLHAGRYGQVGLAQEERLRGRRGIVTATETDSWERRYTTQLGSRSQWFAAGVRDGKPLVHLVYGVDAAVVRALSDRSGTGVPITVRAVFFDAAGRPLATLDTVQVVRRPAEQTRLLAMRAELPVPSGTHLVRFGVEANATTGSVYPIDSLIVPYVDGRKLELSAALVGIPDWSLSWVPARGDSVWLDPAGLYAPTDTLMVYVEAYGVKVGSPYRVKINLTRQRGAIGRLLAGSREAITVTQETTFTETTGVIRRLMGLGGLAAGSYQLEVTVEGAGEKVVRKRLVTVR